MFEDPVSVPSIWASMNSWFTPTVLFVLLNVMIGTIAFTSSFANQKQPQHQHQHRQTQDDHQQPRLARSASVLQRLKSISLYTYRYQEPNPSLSITTHLKPTPDWDTHYHPQQTRQQQTLEAEGQYYFQHHQEQEPLQAETQFVAEQNLDDVEIVPEDDGQTMDEEVDAKADDFINRFKQQLKLQRLDSIVRYKELINRGSEK